MQGRSLHTLVSSRRCFTAAAPDLPARVIFFTQGGMGDRINFQAIVADEIRRACGKVRVVAAIPFHDGEYDAHHYRPRPDEVWVIPQPKEIGPLLSLFPAIAAALLPEAAAIDAVLCEGREELRPLLPKGLEFLNFYHRVRDLAAQGHYPQLPLAAATQRQAREELSAAGAFEGAGPVVAIHCRQFCSLTPGEAAKNPSLERMADLAFLLRERLDARLVLVAGEEEIPEWFRAHFCHRAPADRTLALSAAVLRHCDLFVGGDSGPLHLAAAVGIPVLCLRQGTPDWLFGPFCPPERLGCVEGRTVERGDNAFLEFDPAVALEAASRLLGLRRAEGKRCAAAPAPGMAPSLTGSDWETVMALAELPDAKEARLVFDLEGTATRWARLEAAAYFLKRGVQVEIRLPEDLLDDETVIRTVEAAAGEGLSLVVATASTAGLLSRVTKGALRRLAQYVVVELLLPQVESDVEIQVRELARAGVRPELRVAAEPAVVPQRPESIEESVLRLADVCREVGLRLRPCCDLCPVFSDRGMGRLARGGAGFFCRGALAVLPSWELAGCPFGGTVSGDLFGYREWKELRTLASANCALRSTADGRPASGRLFEEGLAFLSLD